MKFDFAKIVDQELSDLVWTGSNQVNQLIDVGQRRMLFWKRNGRYLFMLLLPALFCLVIYITWIILQ